MPSRHISTLLERSDDQSQICMQLAGTQWLIFHLSLAYVPDPRYLASVFTLWAFRIINLWDLVGRLAVLKAMETKTKTDQTHRDWFLDFFSCSQLLLNNQITILSVAFWKLLVSESCPYLQEWVGVRVGVSLDSAVTPFMRSEQI